MAKTAKVDNNADRGSSGLNITCEMKGAKTA